MISHLTYTATRSESSSASLNADNKYIDGENRTDTENGRIDDNTSNNNNGYHGWTAQYQLIVRNMNFSQYGTGLVPKVMELRCRQCWWPCRNWGFWFFMLLWENKKNKNPCSRLDPILTRNLGFPMHLTLDEYQNRYSWGCLKRQVEYTTSLAFSKFQHPHREKGLYSQIETCWKQAAIEPKFK